MNRAGSNKLIGALLVVLGLGAYLFGGFYFFGGFGLFIPLGAIIAGIVFLFMPNKKNTAQTPARGKTYKAPEVSGPMKMHYIFYIVGVIFIFASVWYFTREFIAELPNIVKLILLIISVIVSFIVAEFMRRAEI